MIRLNRNKSRLLAILTLVLFAGLGILMVKKNQPLKRLKKNLDYSSSEITTTGFTLNDFRRTESKNGKTIWKVNAQIGEYLKGQDSAKLTKAFLVLYQENGDIVEVTSDSALLSLEGNELKSAEMSGNVVMNVNKERYVHTEKAIYEKVKDLITAPGYAKIEDSNMVLEGESLVVKVEEQFLSFDRNVKTTVKKKTNT
jgi:LPS export ABC transporter protein LptC